MDSLADIMPLMGIYNHHIIKVDKYGLMEYNVDINIVRNICKWKINDCDTYYLLILQSLTTP